ncbi:hypothetical protein IW146_001076 [Coemansia sp. RSA 922]|nr:hypothetical protein GGI08_000906 [Coemansia sp. S2]KAJ2117014.1 hypothetical protein IW146_001076 [Coemansia sp. RSA 922]KAJ2424165.1 hypothetical protein GGF41_002868 [Coemansia sp. RSA 2531]
MGQLYTYETSTLRIVRNVTEYDSCASDLDTHLIILAPTEESATITYNVISERASDNQLKCIAVVPSEPRASTGNPVVVIVTWIIADGLPSDFFNRIFVIAKNYNAIPGNPVIITTVKHVSAEAMVHQVLND